MCLILEYEVECGKVVAAMVICEGAGAIGSVFSTSAIPTRAQHSYWLIVGTRNSFSSHIS